MNGYGITLQVLRVIGQNKRPAEVIFSPGLNVVTGLSDTGKSYILQLIDFMLGAKSQPKEIDESKGYTTSQLQIRDHQDNIYTLERSLQGGNFNVYSQPINEIQEHSEKRVLKPISDAKNTDNISSFILSLSGFSDAKIKKNAQNATEKLSFRTISHLFLINETDIISEASPLEPKNAFEKTKLRSAFKFLLTGRDDSELVSSEDPKIAQARLLAKLETYDQLIADLEAKVKSQISDSMSVSARLKELQNNVSELSNSVSASSAEISRYQQVRRQAWIEQEEANSRIVAISEILIRFDLLREHYQSDLRRLDFTSEGDHYFEQLEPVFCPFCGTPLEEHTSKMLCVERQGELVDIQTACQEEAAKITRLMRDLEQTVEPLTREREERIVVVQQKASVIAEADAYITQVLRPKDIAVRSELEEIQAAYRVLAEIEVNNTRLQELKDAKLALQQSIVPTINPNESSSQPIDAAALRRFCDTVEALLRSWKYPDVGTVEFDQQQMDIIINGKPRRNNGKGVRAITRTAFNIGLMRYCLRESLPHTCFLIFDSPLTTFKENKGDQANEEVSGEVQEAFFEDLSTTDESEQIIILENKTPPLKIRQNINVIEFTGRRGSDRRGFFPVNQ